MFLHHFISLIANVESKRGGEVTCRRTECFLRASTQMDMFFFHFISTKSSRFLFTLTQPDLRKEMSYFPPDGVIKKVEMSGCGNSNYPYQGETCREWPEKQFSQNRNKKRVILSQTNLGECKYFSFL